MCDPTWWQVVIFTFGIIAVGFAVLFATIWTVEALLAAKDYDKRRHEFAESKDFEGRLINYGGHIDSVVARVRTLEQSIDELTTKKGTKKHGK